MDDVHAVTGARFWYLEFTLRLLSSSTSTAALAGEMRWLGDTEALGGIPETMFRFFPLPGKEVTLNGPKSLKLAGMVQTSFPARVGSGAEGGDLACDGKGKEASEVEGGSKTEVDGGSGKGSTVSTTVSVIVWGGRDKEIVTVEASSETVLVCVVVAVAVEVDMRVMVSISVSVSVSVSVCSRPSLKAVPGVPLDVASSSEEGDGDGSPSRSGGAGRSMARIAGKGGLLELSLERGVVD